MPEKLYTEEEKREVLEEARLLMRMTEDSTVEKRDDTPSMVNPGGHAVDDHARPKTGMTDSLAMGMAFHQGSVASPAGMGLSNSLGNRKEEKRERGWSLAGRKERGSESGQGRGKSRREAGGNTAHIAADEPLSMDSARLPEPLVFEPSHGGVKQQEEFDMQASIDSSSRHRTRRRLGYARGYLKENVGVATLVCAAILIVLCIIAIINFNVLDMARSLVQ